MLLDLQTLAWSDELLDDLAIPRSLLPEIVPTTGELAVTSADVIGAEVPVAGCAGDQQAALFGQACFEPGQAKSTYGTGSFVLANMGSEPARGESRLLSTVAWQLDGDATYALEGAVFVAARRARHHP
jgi:glycerol kinase